MPTFQHTKFIFLMSNQSFKCGSFALACHLFVQNLQCRVAVLCVVEKIWGMHVVQISEMHLFVGFSFMRLGIWQAQPLSIDNHLILIIVY